MFFRDFATVRVMLNKAIFLATCNVIMMTENRQIAEEVSQVSNMLNHNLQHAKWKLFTTLSLAASLKSPASKRHTLIGSFYQNCVASCNHHVTHSNLSHKIAKS